MKVNSVQTRCSVKGETQKSPLFWRFSGVFDFLRIACSLGIPQENLKFNIKSPIFTNTPCKSTCIYNAPSMHTVEKSLCVGEWFFDAFEHEFSFDLRALWDGRGSSAS